MGTSSGTAASGSSTFSATTFLMINNTIGAGLLALPYTFKRSSLIIGAVAMLTTGLLNYSAMVLISRSCEISGATSYTDLATLALGKRASTLIAAILSIYTLGSCASYVVLLGDALPEIADLAGAGSSVYGSSTFLLAISSLVFLMPLSSMRNLKSLRFTAVGALLIILYTAGLIAIRAASNPRNASVVLVRGDDGLFIGIPVTMVSFTMHYNTPRLFFELKDRSTRKMASIGAVSFGAALVLYELTAYCGYSLFGADTKSDILANFNDNDTAANVARVGLAIVMIVSFPIVLNAFRAAVTSLLPESWQRQIENGDKNDEEVENGGKESLGLFGLAERLARDWAFLLLTFALVALSLGTALAIPNLGLILGYKGALGGTLIVYVLPAVFYFVLLGRSKGDTSKVGSAVSIRTSSRTILSPFLSPNLLGREEDEQQTSVETPLIAFSPTGISHTPLDWDGSNQSPMTILGEKTPRGDDTLSVTMKSAVESKHDDAVIPFKGRLVSFEGCVLIFFSVWGLSVMILGVLTTSAIIT